MDGVYLISVEASKAPTKKWTATFGFKNLKHTKQVSFGSANMDDYTITKNKEQRDRYRARHAKDLNTNNPTRPGFLSYYILWGDSTSMRTNIANYKKKFNL